MTVTKPSCKTRGISYMILSAFSFGTMTAFVKWATETLPPFEVVFFRSLLGTVLISLVMLQKKVSFRGKSPRLLLFRGLFGWMALAMHFYTISKLNVGTAVILNFTSPIFVAIIAFIFLKEKLSNLLWVLTVTSLLGLYFIVGGQVLIKPFPVLIGLFSAVWAALAIVTIRMSGKTESPYTIIFYFTSFATCATLPLLFFGFEWPNAQEWIAIGGVVLASFFGQIFLTKSVLEAPASMVSPFSLLAPCFSFIYGYVIWNDPFTLQMSMGVALVIASTASIYFLEGHPIPARD